MATPKKLPSGNWRIQVFSHKENGKNKYVSFTAPTKAEANRLAAEFQANRYQEDKPQNITIKDAIQNYIDSKTNVLSPSTLRNYHQCMKYYKPIENIKIGSISSTDLQFFINDISKGRSAKTVQNIYGLLISSIKMYSDRNYRVTLPTRKPIERNIPTDADINNLLDNASPNLKLAILLSSVGTLRRGEICALKYADILYDFNAIYVHADLILGDDGWFYKEMPKTSSSTRRVTLPKDIIEMLGNGEPDEYVIKIKPSTITADFDNLKKKLGLKCRFHDLRHYAASILHAIGIPDVYIMERGGWSSDRVLKSVYRNSLSDKSAHFTSLANDYFEKKIISHEISHDKKEVQ